MINYIVGFGTLGIAIGGAIGAILTTKYKTNKEATEDYNKIKLDYEKELQEIKEDYDSKIKELKNDLTKDTDKFAINFKQDLDRISDKIDEMKTHYVSNENFKTYAESVNQLLKMSTDRMGRIENALDDIRDDLGSFLRKEM